VPDREAKSISAECTYDEDLVSNEAIARSLLAHSARVAERLVAEGLRARAIVVKLKFADFTIHTRRKALPSAVADARSIHLACLELLARFPRKGDRVRLTGVAAQDIEHATNIQPELFPDPVDVQRRGFQSVMSSANDRFGGHAVTFATLLEDDAPRADPLGPRLPHPPHPSRPNPTHKGHDGRERQPGRGATSKRT
jgi:DNA polymerase-4